MADNLFVMDDATMISQNLGVVETLSSVTKTSSQLDRAFGPKTSLAPVVHFIEEDDSDTEKELLVVSPYTTRSHLLNLSSVDQECALLARALTLMSPIRQDYATAPYDAAFNWTAVVDKLQRLILAEKKKFKASRFYIIVFRSQLPRSTDRSRLGKLDELAHQEAMESGYLLKYWFGTPDRNGRNLATCLWRHRDDARLGGAGPGHAKAMQETKALYTEWQVERLSLNVSSGAQSWSITKWLD